VCVKKRLFWNPSPPVVSAVPMTSHTLVMWTTKHTRETTEPYPIQDAGLQREQWKRFRSAADFPYCSRALSELRLERTGEKIRLPAESGTQLVELAGSIANGNESFL
jgi:hypothetical protein